MFISHANLSQDAPDYYAVILEPIDLKLITMRVRDKAYSTKDMFARDIQKVGLTDSAHPRTNVTLGVFICGHLTSLHAQLHL